MEQAEPRIADLAALAAEAQAHGDIGAIWSLVASDLNINLVRFNGIDGVEEHRNTEVDVIGVAIAGEGIVAIEGREERVHAGQLFFMPKGTRRAIHAAGGSFAYLTCHRRRQGLMPTRAMLEDRRRS